MKMLVVLAVALFLATQVRADPTIVYGAGRSSCGTFTDTIDKPYAEGQWGSWLAGFVSGYNLGKTNQAKPVDAQSIIAFVRKYCADNPLETVFTAANQLLIEAPKERVPAK